MLFTKKSQSLRNFGQDNDVDGLRDVLVADPSLVDGQVEFVVVADEVVVGADGESHPFLELAFPGLVAQGDVDFHLGKRHDDRLLKGLGDFEGLVGGLPLAVKVLVAFGEQQVIRSCLVDLHDVAAKLEVVDKVGLGAAPIGLTDEFLERESGRIVVARQAIIHAEGGFSEVTVELCPCHHWQKGKEKKCIFFHEWIFCTKVDIFSILLHQICK